MTSPHQIIATDFLTLVTNGNIDEAYEKYVSSDFIHHNPYFAGDRASLIKAMKESHLKMPDKIFDIQNIWEDGDRVITHSHLQTSSMNMSVIHILRFEDNKIRELWDIGQPIPTEHINTNSVF